ncbi:MAG TPA: hypothetical protein VL017_08255, partial [Devosia sp.]|nr:hypothetical protein [Devosia sp.]
MAFVNPTKHGTLNIVVEIAFGFDIHDDPATFTWTDISKYVIGNITMSAGKPDQADTADPARISLMLANTDGRFTALSPTLTNG